MRSLAVSLPLTLAICLAPLPVTALIYDEAVSGDLPQALAESPLLALSAGTNLIQGTLRFSFAESCMPTDFDSIRLHIPSTLRLSSMTMRLDLVGPTTPPNNIFDRIDWTVRSDQQPSYNISTHPPTFVSSEFERLRGVAEGLSLESNLFGGSLRQGFFREARYALKVMTCGR